MEMASEFGNPTFVSGDMVAIKAKVRNILEKKPDMYGFYIEYTKQN